jgi:hypothetical protein
VLVPASQTKSVATAMSDQQDLQQLREEVYCLQQKLNEDEHDKKWRAQQELNLQPLVP